MQTPLAPTLPPSLAPALPPTLPLALPPTLPLALPPTLPPIMPPNPPAMASIGSSSKDPVCPITLFGSCAMTAGLTTSARFCA